jgi:hypothetical protein
MLNRFVEANKSGRMSGFGECHVKVW